MRVVHCDCRAAAKSEFKPAGDMILDEQPMKCQGCGDNILYNHKTGRMTYRGNV